jgi:hypothetical protein
MGLLNRSYPTDEVFDPTGKNTQWERFANYVQHLNRAANTADFYKVLYLGRHGEGFHNVVEAAVGTPMWDVWFLILGLKFQLLTELVLLVQAGGKRHYHLGQCRLDSNGNIAGS